MLESPNVLPTVPLGESREALKPESSRRKPPFLVIVGIILLIAITSALWLFARGKQKGQVDLEPMTSELEQIEETDQLAPASFQDTILFFTTPLSVTSGKKIALPISIDTGDNTVSAVQLKLQYDPRVLSQVTIEPGQFFDNPSVLQSLLDQSRGIVLFVLGSLKPKQGSGQIVILKATIAPGAAGETTISFAPETEAAAINELGNVLKQAEAITLQILSP